MLKQEGFILSLRYTEITQNRSCMASCVNLTKLYYNENLSVS